MCPRSVPRAGPSRPSRTFLPFPVCSTSARCPTWSSLCSGIQAHGCSLRGGSNAGILPGFGVSSHCSRAPGLGDTTPIEPSCCRGRVRGRGNKGNFGCALGQLWAAQTSPEVAAKPSRRSLQSGAAPGVQETPNTESRSSQCQETPLSCTVPARVCCRCCAEASHKGWDHKIS